MRRPILELMTRGSFIILAEQPHTEIVVGTIGQFWAGRAVDFKNAAGFRAFRDPRYAKVAMNFRVRDEGNGWCKVTTETRVACPDPSTRRKFDQYWRVIYPGSSIIRSQWLQAIRRRAEKPAVIESPTSLARPGVIRRSLPGAQGTALVARPDAWITAFTCMISCLHATACIHHLALIA